MHFDHIEAGAIRIAGGLRVVVAHAIHLAAGDLAWYLHELVEGERRRGDEFPVAVRQRMIHPLPAAPGRTLAAGMAELKAELRGALLMHEIADAPPGGDLFVGINAGTARRNPSRLRYRRHFGKHEPSPTHSELAKVDKMKVPRNAAGLRRV